MIKQYIFSNSCSVEKADNNGKINDNNEKDEYLQVLVVVEVSREDQLISMLTPS